MKISIKYRLFLAFFAATFTVVACMFLITKLSFDRGFMRYIKTMEQQRIEQLADQLQRHYAEQGNWAFVRDNPRRWLQIVATSSPDGPAPLPLPLRQPAEWPNNGAILPPFPPPPLGGHHFETRLILLDGNRQPIVSPRPDSKIEGNLRTLQHQGQKIGYLGLLPPRAIVDPQQRNFADRQRRAFALIALAVATAAALLSLPLSRRLVRRITDLAAATHRLAAGQYDARVTATASDELGQLARDFNSLAGNLEQNQQLRRQWVADISHELRTPLAVLRGEIEAIQDGVRTQTPQSLNMLHGEVMQLSRLVEDLYQLSLADIDALSCRKELINLTDTLQQAVAPFRGELEVRNIQLTSDTSNAPGLLILGDDRRLHQLFGNLLENSLRYTDAGGKLRIRLTREGGQAFIRIEDSAPEVPVDKLPHLFDRLYRVESSRSRRTGGAGLGLALCKTIVEAHDGSIVAHPSELGGLLITIQLPLQKVTS